MNTLPKNSIIYKCVPEFYIFIVREGGVILFRVDGMCVCRSAICLSTVTLCSNVLRSLRSSLRISSMESDVVGFCVACHDPVDESIIW